MDTNDIVAVLSALAQPTRLETMRLLIAREPDGVAAGEVARLADVPQNTMSGHLAVLSRAGLVTGTRHSRTIVYRANLGRLREVVDHLVRDCCGGDPALCGFVVADLAACCPPPRKGSRT